MAKDLHDRPWVCTSHEQVTGRAVAQVMKPHVLELGVLDGLGERTLHVPDWENFPALDPPNQAPENLLDPWVHGDGPGVARLAVPDADLLAQEIAVPLLEG